MTQTRSLQIIVKTLILIVLLISPGYAYAQHSENKDSLKLYKKLKKVAYKYKMTTWAYDMLFIDPEPKEYPKHPASKEEKNVNPYLKYQGRIIRNINITVYDPFGYSVADTTPRKVNLSQKAGNNLHIKTRKWVIHNKLLFKRNDSLSALNLSETERLLREAVNVNDARISVTSLKSKDSVDVNVVVLDKWPVTIPILVTDMRANARFRNLNLFGLGQQFEHYTGYTRAGVLDYNGFYNIANIDNTYISSRFSYQKNTDGTLLSLAFDKPFYSFLASWAGGVAVNHSWRSYLHNDTTVAITRALPLNNLGYDVWAARAFKISKSKTLLSQSTNLIVGGRFYQTTYLNRPSFETIDTLHTNINTTAFIGNFGIAVQQYYKDKYIYRFGANEDVPEGLIVQILYGGLKREFNKLRYYSGFEIARAKHFDFGYLSATFSYGIFYNRGLSTDVTTNYQLYYFSDLKRKGKWFFRQFLNFNIVHGENKLAKETITIRPDELYGFSNGTLAGNTKMILNSETVAYMPYKLVGFRFAPVLMAGLGVIGDPQHRVTRSRLYQGYSLGIMVRNENLLSSTFQISIGLYPFLPEGGNYVFKYNPVTSFTLRVRAFAVSAPSFVAY